MDISLADKVTLNFALSLREACAIARVGRSQLYLALKSGALRAKKRGNSTLILPADLRSWIEALPDWTPSKTNCSPKSGAGKAEKPPAVKAAAPVKKRVLRPRQAEMDAPPRRRRLQAAE